MKRQLSEFVGPGHNEPFYSNPMAQQILKASCRLETICRLLEHGTDAPATLDFCFQQATRELNEVLEEYYKH
jgi:hypothetical protein